MYIYDMFWAKLPVNFWVFPAKVSVVNDLKIGVLEELKMPGGGGSKALNAKKLIVRANVFEYMYVAIWNVQKLLPRTSFRQEILENNDDNGITENLFKYNQDMPS